MITWNEGGLGAEPPRMYLKTTLFTLAINVASALFHIRIVFEKHAKVAALESRESMFVICWQ